MASPEALDLALASAYFLRAGRFSIHCSLVSGAGLVTGLSILFCHLAVVPRVSLPPSLAEGTAVERARIESDAVRSAAEQPIL